jgi:hypothetical protein
MSLGAELDQRLMNWYIGAMELQVIGFSVELQCGWTGVLENIIFIICRLLRLFIKIGETKKNMMEELALIRSPQIL